MVNNTAKSPGKMDNFWETAHNNNKQYELTGSSSEGVFKFLNVSKADLSKVKTCLVIGVGFGFETRDLAAMGIEVSVLDISPKALDRVKGVTKNRYLPSQLKNIPDDSFDLIISHLVAQHMSNPDLEDQIGNCVRALKSGGTFAIQFSSKFNGNYDGLDAKTTTEQQMAGLVKRSYAYVDSIVKNSKGKITWRSLPVYYPHVNYHWYGIHIQKTGAPDKSTSALKQAGWMFGFFGYCAKVLSKRLVHIAKHGQREASSTDS